MIVSRQALIDSKFSTVVCAPIFSHAQGLPTQVSVGVAEGLKRMKASGADVVLIDPQFAPKVIAKAGAEPMIRMISAAAKEGSVQLFHRFAAMRYWRETDKIPFESFLAPDLLHMNDWGYNCMAQMLADAIGAAATRVPQTASAPANR